MSAPLFRDLRWSHGALPNCNPGPRPGTGIDAPEPWPISTRTSCGCTSEDVAGSTKVWGKRGRGTGHSSR